MPRQNPIEQNVRQQVALGLNPVGARVVANPVSQMVTPAYSDAFRLTQALASVEPALQKMGESFLKKQEEQNNFALQMQALDDGAAGKDSAMPDNAIYQSSYLRGRTSKMTNDFDSEVAALRETVRLNPETDFEAGLKEITKKYQDSAMQYSGLSGMVGNGMSASAKAARSEVTKEVSQYQQTKGAADVLMGVAPQSNNPYYLKGIELGTVTSEGEKIKAKMSEFFLQNAENPEVNMQEGLQSIMKEGTNGLETASPAALMAMVPAVRGHMMQLMHAHSKLQQDLLQKQAIDSNEQGHLALARSTTSTPEEALGSMETYNEGYGPIIPKSQQRLNILKSLQTLGDENAPRAMAILNAQTKDGIRLRDTKEGADLYNKIAAAHEKAVKEANKPAIDQAKFDLKTRLDAALKMDPQKLLDNKEQIRAHIGSGLLGAEEGSQYIKQAIDAVMENEKLAVQKALINGPQAGFYRMSNPETAALWQKEERAAYENYMATQLDVTSKLNTEQDPSVRKQLQTTLVENSQKFVETRLRDGMIGRGLSPMINEMLKAGVINPADANGNATPEMVLAMDIYKTAMVKNSPELMNQLDKEAMVTIAANYQTAALRFNGDLDAAMRHMRAEEIKKSKDPTGLSRKAMPIGAKEMESMATPWAKKYGIKYMPDGLHDEVSKLAGRMSVQNPHLDENIVKSEAFKAVLNSYVQVGDRAMRVPDGTTEAQKPHYISYFNQLSSRFEAAGKTLTGVVFDSATNKVDLIGLDKDTQLPLRETVSREELNKDMDKLTFINEAQKIEVMQAIRHDVDAMNRVSKIIEPGSPKYDHPADASVAGFEKLQKHRDRFNTAVNGYLNKVANEPDLNRRTQLLMELNIAMTGDPNSLSAWSKAHIGMPLEKYAKIGAAWLADYGIAHPAMALYALVEKTKKEYLYEKNTLDAQSVVDGTKAANPTGFGSVEETVAAGKKSSSIVQLTSMKNNAAQLQGELKNPDQHSLQLAFTGLIEGFSGTPYKDAGGLAAGFGYNMTFNQHRVQKDLKTIGRSDDEIKRLIAGDKSVPPLTRDEGKKLFGLYVNDLTNELVGRVGASAWKSLTKPQQIVAVDMVFNFGVPNAMKTRALNSLIQGDSDAFLKHYKEMAAKQQGAEHVNNFKNRLGYYASMLGAPDAITGITRHLGAVQR